VLEKTMYYVGSYEKEVIEGGDTNEYDYIYSPEGLSAIAVKTGGVRTLYYTHIDHLGSLRVVTTQAKAIQSRYHYDAWGIRTVIAGPSITNRGFTGHEHLPEFGFINMNARLYDPVLGRFLAMDPFVQMPDYTQAFNRYAYAMSNPLIYVDENGEFWHIIIGAVVGGVINLTIKAIQGKINSWGDGLMAFGIGAAAGALGAATGGAIFAAAGGAAGGAGGFLAGAASGAGGTAISSPILSAGNTLYFEDPIMTPQQYLLGIAGGAFLGGSVNGVTALANGRSFWSGNPWETVTNYSLPNGNLPIHQQELKTVGCTQETLESIAEYKGQPINIADKSQGADFAKLVNDLRTNNEISFSTRTVMPGTPNSEHLVGAQLNIGNPSAITYNNRGTMHTVGLNRIQMQQVPRVLGSGFRTRTLIQVMDPLYSTYQNLSTSLFRSGYIRVVIP